MKNIYIIILSLSGIFSCNQDNTTDPKMPAEQTDSIQLLNKIHDFGTIKKSDTLTCSFELINHSEKPLVIKNVSPSCGCTTAEFPKGFIKKGERAKVDVIYIPTTTGYSRKSVVVETNLNPPFRVFYLEGNVE